MQIIQQILSSAVFSERPPVLIDIGASGGIHDKWKEIAPYAICIAFDADDREFNAEENTSSGYKKLVRINRIVTETSVASADFYLTASPFCSSLLQPQEDKLEPWVFKSLFKTEKKIQLPATTITEALNQAGINYIDWFKTDTQGTDLRLFLSVSASVQQNVLAAEFEPGIMDAYEGEDKLYAVMQAMHKAGFWLSSMEVKSIQRLNERYVQEFGRFNMNNTVRKSPGWAEVTYLRQPIFADLRQTLLLIVFALMEKQYGFALEVCDTALKTNPHSSIEAARKSVLSELKMQKLKIPLVILKKRFNRLMANINA